MIPQITYSKISSRVVLSFLTKLKESEFLGDIHSDYASRVVSSSDNSIYQVIPQAVLFPKNFEDIRKILKISNEKKFRKTIKITPRGGGTATNGQSLTDGIVLDCSRYMNKILETNFDEGWVRVEPGVVLDQLNKHLASKNMFFAPDLSPSNRATLGGMISTDACGKGSRVYGRTSDHVLELSCVLSNGDLFRFVPIDNKTLNKYKNKTGILGKIFKIVDKAVSEKKNLIDEIFPKMSRFMTGYNLAKVYGNLEKKFNLNYLISGSEGTLVIVSEAKLKLTPLPKYKFLMVVKYEFFDDALRDAEKFLKYNPVAIETIDEKVLSLAKTDEIFFKIKDFITDETFEEEKIIRSTRSISLIEFCGNNEKNLKKQIKIFSESIDLKKNNKGEAIGYYLTSDSQEIKDLWTLRKKGVGLLGNTSGLRKPLPFVEDTVVPQKNLAKYIFEFRAILDSYNIEYAMFGHVDVGCLHVRPALDLKNPIEEKWIRELSDKVVTLVKKYEGVMWGEHGRGFRSEYTEKFFGNELYKQLRIIKEAFDPNNKLNPGKIVTPFSMNKNKIVSLDGPLRGHYDRQINPDLFDEYISAMNCNGNGACHDYFKDSLMCPTSRVTRNRLHSPQGRANLIREWLRIISLNGIVSQPRKKKKNDRFSEFSKDIFFSFKKFFKKILNTFYKHKGKYDFSNEVYNSMNGCLVCKGCVTQCPVHVNIPELRSKFLNLYHTRYLHPLKDYFIGSTESIGSFLSKFPTLTNKFFSTSFFLKILQNQIGLRDLPKFSPEPVGKGLLKNSNTKNSFNELSALSSKELESSLILLQDAFTSFYESQLVIEFHELLSKLGFKVFVAPFHPNGKPLHVKGFLNRFHRVVEKNINMLTHLSNFQVPIVGIDPSIVLTYRDEYPKIIGKDNLGFKVMLPQEFLLSKSSNLKDFSVSKKLNDYKLLGHCIEKVDAQFSQLQWKDLFSCFNLSLEVIEVGCCGMAGTFGHETEHFDDSLGMYNLSWKKNIPENHYLRGNVLVTGFSCRSQIMRFEGYRPLHPVQALLREIGDVN